MTMYIRTLILLLSLPVLSGCATAVLRPEGEAMPVRFNFRAPSATSVSLVGSFNQWDPARDALHGPDADGAWTIVLQLLSGRYEYRFVLNGSEWVPDPRAPSVDDGLGGTNSLIIVGQ
jgi:1,4-alpha-glucan branching enzyme